MEGPLILIVEDNDKNRKLARDVLQVSGYRTAEAVSGEEALEMARDRPPALVLMDIRLPGMDGIAAFRRLREDPSTRHVPVVALTASVMSEDRMRIHDAGFEACLAKPFELRELLALVARLAGAAAGAPREEAP